MKRRSFLGAALGSCALPLAARAATTGRVVVVGGGWGGLAAARHLRELAPQLDVTLIDRQPEFWSQPLSNRWLVGLAKSEWLQHDTRRAAQRFGYRFVAAEVGGIDRQRREVATAAGKFPYDWLVLAVGIREDFSAWYGVDRDSATHTRRRFPSAFPAGRDHLALKVKLEAFRGGDLVMTIPPMPYRCPPAPYERAGLIAWWLKTRNIKGRLVVLDPNLPVISFDRIFRDAYRDQITYLPQARIKSLDPFKRRIVTDFDTVDFSDAILMPPQQAADLVWDSGLIGTGTDGKPSGWAACDPVTLNAADDERVFLVGDLLDKVSPLFGQYPKTGQLAATLGRIAAVQIAARAAGTTAERLLPESTCYVINRPEPRELTRIETSYRWRGDGVIQQTARQQYDPQAGDADLDWARRWFAELLGSAG
ncbi:FAD-dependent oxidoreductase [Dechloromonas sp. H13]|uniref:FAD-dependent oxidoreductase n=1 Tax=Dechloromonas sp. H13 TaxID=2570193 RepID=UPI0012921B22|nr:FAD/NAD(P)-binding oxidoreductase [Dechloromonas sp. H13]